MSLEHIVRCDPLHVRAVRIHHVQLNLLYLHSLKLSRAGLLPSTWAHGWFDLNGDGVYDDFHTVDNTAFCTGAGGQVYTTSADLAKLGKALMHDRTILQEATYGEMTDFYFPVGHDEPMVFGYGLGLMWFHDSYTGGHEVWGHGGNAPGYAAGMLYLPD
jgi:CubicO group peptidase (beta-lactamase class C family)